MTQQNNNSDNQNNMDRDADMDNNYDTDTENEYDDDYADEIIYEADEESNTKYNITLCEIFNKLIHGKSNTEVNTHYLTICRFKELDMTVINDMATLYNSSIMERSRQFTPHNSIRNYGTMISSQNYIKPEIGENIYLESGHCVCIIKTVWLKLIQRAWKKNYKMKKDINQRRHSLTAINYRKVTGNWPENCRYLPTLKGMLSKLSK